MSGKDYRKPTCATRAGVRSEGLGRWLITTAKCKATVSKDADLLRVKHISGRVGMQLGVQRFRF